MWSDTKKVAHQQEPNISDQPWWRHKTARQSSQLVMLGGRMLPRLNVNVSVSEPPIRGPGMENNAKA
jgi:hypothetical protein